VSRQPCRVTDGMRERLARLSQPAQDAATVAASLGQAFCASDLARMLDVAPSALIAPISELLEASLFVEREHELAFWHDITRQAVRTSVPVSVRRALDRQAADILLERGALPLEVAGQLAASAEPGDDAAVTLLLDAARAIVASDPAMAAEFGARALEIGSRDHPRRGEIVAVTAIAMHIVGDRDEAMAFADKALREVLPAEQEAQVRLSIAGMFAISPDTRIAAGRTALALPELSEALHAQHLACLLHNLITGGWAD